MAEMVSSVVVQEAVNQIVSSVLSRYAGTSSEEEHLERLEMAQIKLEAALETSEKWHITDASLLRWQKKLKRAAQECADTLHKCRQRVQDQEEMQQEVRNSSFPKRIVHASKSLISSIFYDNSKELSRSAVRRFERFADGASEFLRYVELGGKPHHYTFFDPFIRHLLAGKTLEYKSVRGSKHYLFRIRPFNSIESRREAKMIFVYKDDNAMEDNFLFTLVLQLSESTEIIGMAIKCLQLFTPHFKCIAETVRKELTELPAQDFTWVPYVYSCSTEHLENLHSIRSQWFRPNPLCCKQQGLHKSCGSENIDKLELSDIYLEPVIDVCLEHHISLSGYDNQMTTIQRKRSSPKDFQHLKLVVIFMPHGSSEGHLLPEIESCVIEVINGEEQHCLHTNITLQQLDEIMLPKAIDCLRQNAKMTSYQMIWKSKHGSAYLHIEKKSRQMATKRRTIRRAKNRVLLQQWGQEKENQTVGLCAFLNSWVTHAPVELQASIMDWIQKENDAQLAKNGNGILWGTT